MAMGRLCSSPHRTPVCQPWGMYASQWAVMQRRAATVFERWLARRITPQLAANYGYRPGDPSKQAVAPVDTAHLVDPKQPQAVLELPTPRVLATIKRAWREDRKAEAKKPSK